MKDFFARQEDARKQSGRLLMFFAMAVIGVALAVYLAAAVARLWLLAENGAAVGFWHPQLFLWTTTGTLTFVAAASLWKISELREGGARIAAMLGGKPVPTFTQAPQERMLRNVVEEMAIASGMPPPDLYLLERERGINAFAAGHGVRDAVICVTRGAVELLSRDELQGVVAHEFSHIRNGDVLLNLRLMGWLSGILVVSQAGEMILRGMRRSSGRTAGAIFAVAAALFAIGYIGYFFGQLIKSAVSRQREFLGDASAVQFTRNPTGLSGALKKIGGLSLGSRLEHPRAAEVSHMFFGNGLEAAWLHALDSHPPLDERIRRLEPGFDGRFPAVKPLPPPPSEAAAHVVRPAKAPPESVSALSGVAVAALLERVGEPMQEHIDLARRLLSELPESLTDASRNTFSACAVVYGLLMDADPAVRKEQEQLVEAHDSGAAAVELRRLLPALDGIPSQVRLPLLDLSLPALRSLSPDQYLRLKETSGALSAADGRESLFEFTLRYLLLRHLEPRFFPLTSPRPVQIYGIRGVRKECSCILTTMARVGVRDENAAQGAFARGAMVLNEPKLDFHFLPAVECGKSSMEHAFAILESTSPLIKRRLLAASLECMIHDRIIKIDEVELFRAIADALDCPLPPWLDLSRGESGVTH
jgi:Zn-dependent protease with chaperone function